MSHKELTLDNITTEYSDFLMEELSKTNQEIIDDSRRCDFYSTVYELLSDDKINLSESDYAKLNTKGTKILGSLYHSFERSHQTETDIQHYFSGVVNKYIDRNLSGNYSM